MLRKKSVFALNTACVMNMALCPRHIFYHAHVWLASRPSVGVVSTTLTVLMHMNTNIAGSVIAYLKQTDCAVPRRQHRPYSRLLQTPSESVPVMRLSQLLQALFERRKILSARNSHWTLHKAGSCKIPVHSFARQRPRDDLRFAARRPD